MPAVLGAAALVALDGDDALAFAHAQFSSDVKGLRAGHWQWSAWLDAQGRVRHFFALLHLQPSGLLAWLPLGDAAAMRDGLARFVFRARLRLTAPADHVLLALDDADLNAAPAPGLVLAHRDGHAIALPGARVAWFGRGDGGDVDAERLRRWRGADLAAGLPLLAPVLAGEFVPQALGLEAVDAIRFDKGCYPGQEVAARLHFRGGNKRHLRRLRVHGAVPADGAVVVGGDERPVGRILYTSVADDGRASALAVLADDALSMPSLRAEGDTSFAIPDV